MEIKAGSAKMAIGDQPESLQKIRFVVDTFPTWSTRPHGSANFFNQRLRESGTDGNIIRMSSAFVQPILSDDVAEALADIAVSKPLNSTIEVAGPDRVHFDELIRQFLSVTHDARQVITDIHARYYGAELIDHSLTPGANTRIGRTHFDDWLNRSVSQV